MSISLRISDDEYNVIRGYAELHGVTISEVVRLAVMEKIEDEFDIKLYEKAAKEHAASGKTYTHDEVKKELGLI
ncbi:MAG: DUF6290 family protein [Clostridiales bacterium]|jgi:uncharacterized protein (DUF1778 family)|nr:DUF6290 family protein [Clostridiales bacterium]